MHPESQFDLPPKHMEAVRDRPRYLAIGIWGVMGANLTVHTDSVSIDLSGANANFSPRPKLNARGEFNATGRYNQEGPGALPIDRDVSPTRPKVVDGPNARFHGKVNGKKLELTITLVDSGQKLGPYSLEYGKTGRVIKIM